MIRAVSESRHGPNGRNAVSYRKRVRYDMRITQLWKFVIDDGLNWGHASECMMYGEMLKLGELERDISHSCMESSLGLSKPGLGARSNEDPKKKRGGPD